MENSTYSRWGINNKGWIALDIDGTVTDQLHTLPSAVEAYLGGLVSTGWRIMFITGRIFSLAHSVLKALDFPCYLAVQNGADILELPSCTLFSRSYLPASLLPQIASAYQGAEEEFILYAGYERGDLCYYRPARFSAPMRAYLARLQALSRSAWEAVASFEEVVQAAFPLVKCFGKKEAIWEVMARLASISGIEATMIRDAVDPSLYLILITAEEATKGHAVERIMARAGGRGPLIAAGDDFNDRAMLERADVRIVMETAPEELRAKAHIIAPPAARSGIIQGLREAIERL